MSIDTLQSKIQEKKCPLALSLDPSIEDVPACYREGAASTASACAGFTRAVLEAAADLVPAVVFDPAWYIALGPEGLTLLHALLARAGELGLYTLVETLRCDEGDGAALGARTWFEDYGADGLCTAAFTGSDGIRPYLPYVREQGKGLFLLARTAGRSAWEVQDLLSGDRVVHTALLDLAVRWGGKGHGRSGYAPVGAVVAGPSLKELRKQYDRLFFLLPHGCPVEEAQAAFDCLGHGALLETPRGLLRAWRAGEDEPPALRVRAAVQRHWEELRREVQVLG